MLLLFYTFFSNFLELFEFQIYEVDLKSFSIAHCRILSFNKNYQFLFMKVKEKKESTVRLFLQI